MARTDRRPTLTLKGEQFDIEFRSLINRAAERQGQTQAAWVADTLTREAQRVVKGEAEGAAALPMLAEDRLDAAERRLEELTAEVRRLSAGRVGALKEWLRGWLYGVPAG